MVGRAGATQAREKWEAFPGNQARPSEIRGGGEGAPENGNSLVNVFVLSEAHTPIVIGGFSPLGGEGKTV